MTNGPHVLYRVFDGDGELLYIGQTSQPHVRFRKHKDSKSWWDEVRTIDIEHYKSREAAERAERAAIRVEHPIYNVSHNRDDYDWVLEEYDGPEIDATDPRILAAQASWFPREVVA